MTHHLDIVIDILHTLIHDEDHLIWPNSCTGDLTSRMTYDFFSFAPSADRLVLMDLGSIYPTDS